jgi:hypothetical protein
MKPTKSILLVCLLGSIVSAEEAQNAAEQRTAQQVPSPLPQAGLVQPDPRNPPGVALRFTRGTRPAGSDPRAYVIIAWANPPAGSSLRGYQFWGDDRIIGQKELEFVLETVLKERPRDVYVVGNDWAAGNELDASLQELSKRHQIDVFGGSTFRFNQVNFLDEPAEVKDLITKAINQTQTALQVTPTDGDKPSD